MADVYVIDSNVFLRLIVRDVFDQQAETLRFFQSISRGEIKGVTSLLVINEVIWALQKFYSIPRNTFVPVLCDLLMSANISIIEFEKEKLIEVLEEYQQSKLDFTDVFLAKFCEQSHCKLQTFDRKLLQRVEN